MVPLDSHQQQERLPTRFRCCALSAEEKPLAEQFYKAHGSRMKIRAHHTPWVVLRGDRLLACLCLQPVAQGHWLTSLFVHPACRRSGLASTLLAAACAAVEGPIWLFCQPQLEILYRQQGFVRSAGLPESLGAKLQRYQRSKDLIAMSRGA